MYYGDCRKCSVFFVLIIIVDYFLFSFAFSLKNQNKTKKKSSFETYNFKQYLLVAFPHSLNILLTALISLIDNTEIIVMSFFYTDHPYNILAFKFLDLNFYKLVSPLDFSHPVSWLCLKSDFSNNCTFVIMISKFPVLSKTTYISILIISNLAIISSVQQLFNTCVSLTW